MTDKRRGLGRGLSALLPGQPEPASGIRTVPVGRLTPNRYQPRAQFDDAGLEELAASIRASGVLQPIVVTPLSADTYSIIAGERRWRAAQRAGLAEVPVLVRSVETEREQLELALVENLQRADLNALEEADAYRLLAESFGLAHEQIAARVGKSRAAITNTLRLLKLPEPVQDLLRSGVLSAGQARALLALEDPAAIVRLAERAVAQGLSARALEALAAGGRKRPRAKKPAEPNAAAAAERLTRALQTPVDIERRGRGGAIRLRFHSEEELMRLYDLLMARAARS
jgi:ParB family chromosome partitioning protein